MAFKTSTVLDGNLESALDGIPGVAPGSSDETELPSVAGLLAASIFPPGGELTLQRERVDLIESDNYQVALVNFGKTAERVAANAHTVVAMEHVVVLPLTWGENCSSTSFDSILTNRVLRICSELIKFWRQSGARPCSCFERVTAPTNT